MLKSYTKSTDKVIRSLLPDKIVLNLIYKGDRLIELLDQIQDAGYDPSIKYEGGKLTHIGLTIQFACKTKLCMFIRTQQLAPSNNDGECNVSSADIYNNMSSAMNKLNNALFKAEHKSHYSKQDADILDEYRTIVPVGMMKSVYDLIEEDKTKSKVEQDNIRSNFIINKMMIELDQPVYNPKVETKEEDRNKYNDSLKLSYGKKKRIIT